MKGDQNVNNSAGNALPGIEHLERQPSISMTKEAKYAKAATAKEHTMTLMQGIKTYPKAIAWSIIISTCIAMEGYDISLVNNFYAFPPFQRKYGVLTPDGSYQVPASVRRCDSSVVHLRGVLH
jgi:SP family general alpha glucoside:H+ symporter-like MFS transporter